LAENAAKAAVREKAKDTVARMESAGDKEEEAAVEEHL
jgi:hypothetical protein